MANERLPMRKIQDVLRLDAEGMLHRKIAAALGIGRTSSGEYPSREAPADVIWPVPDDLTDEELEKRLYPAAGQQLSQRAHAV